MCVCGSKNLGLPEGPYIYREREIYGDISMCLFSCCSMLKLEQSMPPMLVESESKFKKCQRTRILSPTCLLKKIYGSVKMSSSKEEVFAQ